MCQNVDLLAFRSAIASFESSYLKKAASYSVALSCLRTNEAPQPLQRHLCVPAFVALFFFILALHEGHFGLLTARSRL